MAVEVETKEPLPAEKARQLGRALRARRKALGINMTAAAEAATMSRVTWHRLEKGEPTVACGSLLAAASVLGMELQLVDTAASSTVADSLSVAALPLSIALSDFPGLRQLAWQVGQRVDAVTPREALGLYVRNARHLDVGALSERERSLIQALSDVFGEGVPGV